MEKVLVVDDDTLLLNSLVEVLRRVGYETEAYPDGLSALMAIQSQAEAGDLPDIILTDIHMPTMDGFQLCQALKKDAKLAGIPVIVLSSLSEAKEKVKAFDYGALDFISKPYQRDEVLVRLRTHLEMSRLQSELRRVNASLSEIVAEQIKEISDSQMALIQALAVMVENRDGETGKHIERISGLCELLAKLLFREGRFPSEITPDFVNLITQASPLHDIGKVGIPDSILLKPGKLTGAEFNVIKAHTLIGARTLKKLLDRYPKNPYLRMGMEIARYHHEWWDGSGYPDRLSGASIPLPARIMAICDVYDALRTKRVYKESFSHEESLRLMEEERGSHFDPDIFDVFAANSAAFEAVQREIAEV